MGTKRQRLNDEWAIRDFTSGVNDFYADNLLKDNMSPFSLNFIAATVGKLSKRKGRKRWIDALVDTTGYMQGLYAYLDTGVPYVLAAQGRKLFRAKQGDLAWTLVNEDTAISQYYDLHFETCVNYIVGADGQKMFKLAGTTYSALAAAPVDGRWPIMFKEKLFVCPLSTPSRLKWSDSFAPETWPAVNYFNIQDGDGDEITCIKQLLGELVIFKRRSIHVLRGTSIEDFAMTTADYQVGCIGPRACTQVGNLLYFVGDDGIYIFNGINIKNITRDKIPGLWQTYFSQDVTCAAIEWHGLVIFSFITASITQPNLTLVYVPWTDAFWIWNTEASGYVKFAPTADAQTTLLSFSSIQDAANRIVLQEDVETTDKGVAFTAVHRTKSFDKSSDERLAKAKRVFLSTPIASDFDFNSGDGSAGTWDIATNIPADMTVSASLDYTEPVALETKKQDTMVKYYKIPTRVQVGSTPPTRYNRKWRYIAFVIKHTGTDACSIRGLMVPYKAKAKPKGVDV